MNKRIYRKQIRSAVKEQPFQVSFARIAAWAIIFHLVAYSAAVLIFGK